MWERTTRRKRRPKITLTVPIIAPEKERELVRYQPQQCELFKTVYAARWLGNGWTTPGCFQYTTKGQTNQTLLILKKLDLDLTVNFYFFYVEVFHFQEKIFPCCKFVCLWETEYFTRLHVFGNNQKRCFLPLNKLFQV